MWVETISRALLEQIVNGKYVHPFDDISHYAERAKNAKTEAAKHPKGSVEHSRWMYVHHEAKTAHAEANHNYGRGSYATVEKHRREIPVRHELTRSGDSKNDASFDNESSHHWKGMHEGDRGEIHVKVNGGTPNR